MEDLYKALIGMEEEVAKNVEIKKVSDEVKELCLKFPLEF